MGDPVNPQDVATKEYADNKRTHIIAVHGSYTGNLIEGKYQFSFGGNKAKNAYTGFLIPHSGRIKKIKMISPINKEKRENAVIEEVRLGVRSLGDSMFFRFSRTRLTNSKDDYDGDVSFGETKLIGAIDCVEAYKLNLGLQKPEEDILIKVPVGYRFCFENPLPTWREEEAEVEEGDIINIRTEINLDFPSLSPKWDKPDVSRFENPADDPFLLNSFVVTFLIELDPL